MAASRIGRELVVARAAGTPWKLLEVRYRLGRTRLWTLWNDAGGARATAALRAEAVATAAATVNMCSLDGGAEAVAGSAPIVTASARTR